MKITNILISTVFTIAITSCGFSTDGGGFRTTEKDYTELLYLELDKNNIPYTVTQDGYILYDEPAKKGFLKAQAFVEHYLYDGVSHKMKTLKEQDYFTSLLQSKNLEHYILNKDDGVWVKWFPENEEQERELMLQVVNFSFANR